MKNLFVCVAAAAAVLSSGIAAAQSKDAYLQDSRGVLARSAFNLCWRTGYWTPAQAIAECDPDLVKKVEPAAPPPKAAEPTPPPPPAPKLMPEKVTFSADALFDFDKAVLKPAGKEALDKFADKLNGVKYEVIIAIGHADRIGSDAYNKKLSMRRAESVKTYLVKEKGIAANRVYTDGKGESDPVTKPKDCAGKKGKALISCLQPDRRVEVEVAGTRAVK
ncbi:MAG: OmpA family protein [Betaproteobacteria bacterium]|nr:OmpA family protein [Betaproteobacteria bacterium]